MRIDQLLATLVETDCLLAEAGLLFPSSAQTLVELYQRQQLVQLSLYQPQLSGEIVCVVGEDFKIACSTALIAHLRESRGILRGIHQRLLLLAKLLGLTIGNQGVRNVTKGALNGLLIKQQRLLPLGLS